LSTILTTLSICLSMALVTSIIIVRREARAIFAQTDYGYDLIVGPKASPLQLVLNTIYQIDESPGTIPYKTYEQLTSGETLPNAEKNPTHARAAWALPIAVGDSYKGFRVMAPSPQLFGVDDQGKPLPPDITPGYRRGKKFQFAAGK